MDHYTRVYGLPKNNDTLLIDPTDSRIYGLAYMIVGKTDWICIDGAFDHLFGVASGLLAYNDLIEDDHELRTVFYLLDDNFRPLDIIDRFHYINNPKKIVRDITSIPDESFEPVNFEL